MDPYRSEFGVGAEEISPWTGALAVAGAVHVAWSLFGCAGLFAALTEAAASPSGHGWFGLGAVLFQGPGLLVALPLIVAMAVTAARSRAKGVLGLSIAMIVATQIAYWVTISSMDMSGTC